MWGKTRFVVVSSSSSSSSLVKYFHSFSSQLSARRGKNKKILETSEAQREKKACFSHQHLSHEKKRNERTQQSNCPKLKLVYIIFAVSFPEDRGKTTELLLTPGNPFSHSFSFPNRVSGQPGGKGETECSKTGKKHLFAK